MRTKMAYTWREMDLLCYSYYTVGHVSRNGIASILSLMPYHLEINCTARELCSDDDWSLFKRREEWTLCFLYFIFSEIAILIRTSYYATTKA